MLKRFRKGERGQGTVEYILMIAFGAVLALEVMKYFNDVLNDGMTNLEGNMSYESQSGSGFSN